MDGPTMSPHSEHAHVLPSGSSSSSRCTCNSQQKVNAKNLVVCIDGTSNQFGQNNTNVVKLLAKINLKTTHPEQYAYYSSGIGTRPKSTNIFSRMERAVTDKFDMAAAWNIDEIVKDAYAWLARMYQEGDQIYLFGFSRGAYQVRVLAGMIHEVGLIRTPTEKQIGMAYEYYETIRSGKSKIGQIAKEFKSTFCWTGMRVHFIGVWDTVSSVWLRRGEKLLSKSSSAAHACHFRHALALDELRVKFIPEYFHEMNSQTHDGKSKYIVTSRAPDVARAATNDSGTDLSDGKKNRDFKEVWFAGSHSDVGGGSTPGKSHQAGNVSLLWMRQEAAANGLVLEPTDMVWVPDDLDFGTTNSMSPIWRVIEYMPIKHQVSFSGAGEDNRRLHRLQPRRIIPGQKVHASILFANMYKPQATLGEGFDIPIIHSGLEYTELDNQIWETGLPFEDVTAAQELMTHLGSRQGVAPIYLDRLLFMLQFSPFLTYLLGKLDCRDPLVQANIACALVRLKHERHDAGDEPGRGVDPAQQTLRRIFGLESDATEFNEQQRYLVGELKKAVQKGNSRERTAATKTLLELCETATIRTYLREINLLDIFVDQLKRKGSALLAAYALATCLKYSDMKESIKVNGDLPKHVVGMLKLNYFDDAVGQVEGFQVFGDLMQHADLREQMKNHNITQVLNIKLGRGKPNDIRTSLITLEIFWSLDPDGPWTRELVDRGFQLLQNPAWSVQRAGVTILSALAQTEYGVAALKPRIYEVVEMLIPEGYLLVPNQPTPQQATPAHSTSEVTDPWSPTSLDAPPRPPSWMLGPACALRRLAQNKTLRDHIRETTQYNRLKFLYLSKTLVDEKDTSLWRVKTPHRADVINMLDNMIKAVDEELSDEGLTLIGDTVLLHIQHWDRLLRNRAVGSVIILPAVLGGSVLVTLSEIAFTSIYLCSRIRRSFNLLESQYQDARILDALRSRATEGEHKSDADPGPYGGESASGRHSGEGSDEGSEGIETVHIGTRGSGDIQRPANATSQE